MSELNGTDGNDVLNGTDDSDVLKGGRGNDQIFGGSGDDLIYAGSGADLFDGGSGTDTLFVDISSVEPSELVIRVDLEEGFSTTADEDADPSSDPLSDQLVSIENYRLLGAWDTSITGSSGANVIETGDGDDTLEGAGGDDTLNGGRGNDQIFGGSGDDLIYAGNGADLFDGGSGTDTLFVDISSAEPSELVIRVDLEEGFSTTADEGADPSSDPLSDQLVSIENYRLLGAWDTSITGSSGANVIETGDGDDTLEGAGGDDTLNGGRGNDQIFGGFGDDLIYAGSGADLFDGGSGTDTLFVDISSAEPSELVIRVDLEEGFSTTADEGADPSSDPLSDQLVSIENYRLLGAWDTSITGSSGANVIETGDGDDILNGAGGDDTLNGGLGNDRVVYANSIDSYWIGVQDGSVVILDLSGIEGSDTILNVETFEFAGQIYTFAEVEDHAAQVPVSSVVESSVTVLVDQGVLAEEPILLRGLNERIVFANGVKETHTIEWNGLAFDYTTVDPLIITVTRGDEFTEEFQSEIAEFAPSVADISYVDAVSLIGMEDIDQVIIDVAGSDGNFVDAGIYLV